MSSHVGVLAFYQPLDTRPGTHLASDAANLLVERMAAERISRKLIRMMPPDSIFLRGQNVCRNYIPAKLGGSLEVGGTYFQPPLSARAPTLVPRTHYLPRYREIFGQKQLAASL